MSASLTLLSSLVLASSPAASGAVDQNASLDDQSMRFANTLVTSYTCDLLGFGVDYQGLADWGYTLQDSYVNAGVSEDQAMDQIQAKVRRVRNRVNDAYSAVWAFAPFRAAFIGSGGTERQYRFQKTYMDRCNSLAEAEETSAFFSAPDRRLSGAELTRKARGMIVEARHGTQHGG